MAQNIYPTFRYRDAASMIEWLEKAFGFTVDARHMNGGTVGHAELSFGGSIIMLGETRDDAYGRMVGGPGQPGGKSTYVAADDVDAVYETAKAAGAKSRGAGRPRLWQPRIHLRRPAGQCLSFGTYRPEAK